MADFDGPGLANIPYLELQEGLQEAALPGIAGSLAAPKAGRQGSATGRVGGGAGGALRAKKAGARVPRVRRPSAVAAQAAAGSEDGGEGLVGQVGWLGLPWCLCAVMRPRAAQHAAAHSHNGGCMYGVAPVPLCSRALCQVALTSTCC